MIKKIRVDHRLLHGQVAFSWTSALNAYCILIANDSVVTDELRKTTMKMAKPNGVKLVIKNLADSIRAINSGKTDKYKLFIVVESIRDAQTLLNEITQINELNLGGTKATEKTRSISKAVNITEEEEDILRSLLKQGTDITIQMVPEDTPVPVEKAL